MSIFSKTRRESLMIMFLVIPNFWGPVARSWPCMILFRSVINFRRDLWLPVQNSGTYIVTILISLYLCWLLMLTLRESELYAGILKIVGSGLQRIGGGGTRVWKYFLGVCSFITYLNYFLTCRLCFDQSALITSNTLIVVVNSIRMKILSNLS